MRGQREGETLEYNEPQRAAFRDAYARVFRRQLTMMVLFVAAVAPLAFTDEGGTFFGLSESVLGPIAVTAIIGACIFSIRNWNCPACGRGLGRAFNPTRCPRCGVELRE